MTVAAKAERSRQRGDHPRRTSLVSDPKLRYSAFDAAAEAAMKRGTVLAVAVVVAGGGSCGARRCDWITYSLVAFWCP